jgi:hypothetical protein
MQIQIRTTITTPDTASEVKSTASVAVAEKKWQKKGGAKTKLGLRNRNTPRMKL